ncbi:MAG: M14 family zinc carboxypeptidase [Sulfolobales archaeon]
MSIQRSSLDRDLINKILNNVPNYQYFKTFDELEVSSEELAREHRDIVRIVEIGRTRCKEKIRALIIGKGSRRALLFGAPHPNEPVGTLVLDYLSSALTSDQEIHKMFDYTWIIIKAIDIDGLKLNEGWLKKPFSIETYAKNYYRPAGNVQIEWSFPIKYKRYSFNNPTPETKALMNIINEYKPDFIYSLHNAGFGGVYYYISEEAPLLYPIFQLYPRSLNVPLSLGEPEAPWMIEFTKAIYRMPSVADYYEFIEKQGLDPTQVIKHGGSSYDYAKNLNPRVVELVTEVPYLYDPKIEDLNENKEGVSRREAVLEALEWREKMFEFIRDIYLKSKKIIGERDPCSVSGRLMESLEYFIETLPKSIEAQKRWAKTDPSLERKATVAELFDNKYVSKFYTSLSLGMLYRLLKIEYDKISELRPLFEEVDNKLNELIRSLEENKSYRVIEIQRLVKIQLAAGLYTALYTQLTRRG